MGLKLANNVATTLALGIGLSDTTITVASSTNMPAAADDDYFFLTLQSIDGATIEVVKVIERVGAVLTVQRAQDGTAAAAFTAGAYAEMRLCKAVLEAIDWQAVRNAINGLAGLDGSGKILAAMLPAEALTTAAAAATYATLAALGNYLTTALAASTYATISSLANYLTTANAATTYATIASLSDYLTTAAATSTYEPKASFTANGRSLVGAADYAAMKTLLGLAAASTPAFAGVTLGSGLTLTKLSISSADPVLADLQDGELRMVY